METNTNHENKHDELFHPLWLGIILLFTVITTIGILCLLRKKYGSELYYFFHRLCCIDGINNENHSKHKTYLPMYKLRNWTPSYNPASSASLNVYTIVRNIQMSSLDKELSSIKESSINKDDLSSIAESETVQTTSQSNVGKELNKNRDCETARKFYASMHHTSQCQNSSLTECSNIEPTTQSRKIKRKDSFKFFRTPHFFQSITDPR